ncbi:MAG: hypothetical protein OXN97_21055 [Bryobacterales bacterium]|nr:hypothetical protein [Bryobacterales bacterium]
MQKSGNMVHASWKVTRCLDSQVGKTGYNAAVNGCGQIIAFVSVGISLGGLIVKGQRSTSRDIDELRA